MGFARCAGEPCLAVVIASTHLDGCACPFKPACGDQPLVDLWRLCGGVAGGVVAAAPAMSSLVPAIGALVACGCSCFDLGLG